MATPAEFYLHIMKMFGDSVKGQSDDLDRFFSHEFLQLPLETREALSTWLITRDNSHCTDSDLDALRMIHADYQNTLKHVSDENREEEVTFATLDFVGSNDSLHALNIKVAVIAVFAALASVPIAAGWLKKPLSSFLPNPEVSDSQSKRGSIIK